MNSMDLIKQMPEMLSGQELYEKLADIPAYDEEIRGKSQTEEESSGLYATVAFPPDRYFSA